MSLPPELNRYNGAGATCLLRFVVGTSPSEVCLAAIPSAKLDIVVLGGQRRSRLEPSDEAILLLHESTIALRPNLVFSVLQQCSSNHFLQAHTCC